MIDDSTNENIDELESYFLKVRRDHVDQYNNIVENFKQYHFVLNSGAMSALSVYILSNEDINIWIQSAAIVFFIGTLFSVYGIILDFYWGYSRLSFFDKFFFRALKRDQNDLEAKKREHAKYEHDHFKYDDESIFFRQCNGILAYLFFVFGVSVIIIGNVNSAVFNGLLTAIVLFLVYVLISFRFISRN